MTMDERLHHLFARMPDARVHLYGKEERSGRKVGHINFVGSDMADLARAASTRRAGGTLVVTRAVDGRMGST